ncbi:hypothetical protein [Desulfovibrio inopinatus]|uniref:hypothetical protein n=1 Tax=Desulfovibrio inopinatus TaxID=102109 RepID=UPI000482AB3A|nr:hypothetical protein [Desulfovibrio inopinatus]
MAAVLYGLCIVLLSGQTALCQQTKPFGPPPGMYYTVVAGSYYKDKSDAEHVFETLAAKLPEDILDHLEILKMSMFYLTRLGRFEERESAEPVLAAVKKVFPGAQIAPFKDVQGLDVVRLWKKEVQPSEAKGTAQHNAVKPTPPVLSSVRAFTHETPSLPSVHEKKSRDVSSQQIASAKPTLTSQSTSQTQAPSFALSDESSKTQHAQDVAKTPRKVSTPVLPISVKTPGGETVSPISAPSSIQTATPPAAMEQTPPSTSSASSQEQTEEQSATDGTKTLPKSATPILQLHVPVKVPGGETLLPATPSPKDVHGERTSKTPTALLPERSPVSKAHDDMGGGLQETPEEASALSSPDVSDPGKNVKPVPSPAAEKASVKSNTSNVIAELTPDDTGQSMQAEERVAETESNPIVRIIAGIFALGLLTFVALVMFRRDKKNEPKAFRSITPHLLKAVDTIRLDGLTALVDAAVLRYQRECFYKGGKIVCQGSTTDMKTILVTSCFSKDGKTFSAVALAKTLCSHDDIKVLVVDGAIRNPELHKVFEKPQGPGLLEAVYDNLDPLDLVVPTSKPNLFFLPNGNPDTRQGKSIFYEQMDAILKALKEQYDFIVFDGQSVMQNSEVPLLCSIFDMIVLVAACEKTKWEVLKLATDKLTSSGGNVLGVILNRRKFYIPRFLYGKI